MTKSVSNNVEDGRKLVLEACIVRIMKSRKQLGHTELISEILRQITTFTPEQKRIKQAIESLIEREYLKRDEDNSKLYTYLA